MCCLHKLVQSSLWQGEFFWTDIGKRSGYVYLYLFVCLAAFCSNYGRAGVLCGYLSALCNGNGIGVGTFPCYRAIAGNGRTKRKRIALFKIDGDVVYFGGAGVGGEGCGEC